MAKYFTDEAFFIGETLRKTKYEAKRRRNLEFNIDHDYIMSLLQAQNGKCAITGWTLEFTRGGDYKTGVNPLGCSMDRKDCSKGYIPGNIQLVCNKANILRGAMDLDEFYDLCRSVAKTQESKNEQ